MYLYWGPASTISDVMTNTTITECSTITSISLNEIPVRQTQEVVRSTESLQTNKKKVEQKTTITIAVVLAVFFICWSPFYGSMIVQFICHKLQNDKKLDFHLWFQIYLYTGWIGYLESCLNFIIYAFFSPQFRESFKKQYKQFAKKKIK